MNKTIVMKPNIGKEEERKKKQDERSEYLVNMASKVLDATEDVFDKADPKPTCHDMIDVLALASMFEFARQAKLQCDSVKTMQTVLKRVIWSMQYQLAMFAAPLLDNEKAWDDLFSELEEEGGE